MTFTRTSPARGTIYGMRRTNLAWRAAIAAGVAAVFALTACVGTALPGPTAVPLRPTESASFETDDLTDLMNQLTDAGAPAVTIEVRDGDEVWTSAVGVQSSNSELPASASNTSRVASVTKPMVATMILQLVDEGELTLDTDVEDVLPGVVGGREVTVEQLLQHTSGMPDYVEALALGDPTQILNVLDNGRTQQELVDLALTQQWRFDPGTSWEYSNSNYVVLTMLLEELTGNSLDEELATRITTPLGLTNTSIPDGASMPSNSLHGYVVESGLSIDVTKQDASLWNGAGAVVSTPADVNTFMRALLTGQVLPPQLVGYMLRLNDEGYGLGIQAREDKCPASDATMINSEQVDPTIAPNATATPTSTEGVAAAPSPSVPASWPDAPDDGSGSVIEDDLGTIGVQIGEPGMVYGHLGSGLGYRALTLSSPDGLRQVTVFWTASEINQDNDERVHLAYDIADAALARDC
ncbi:serine hydrolase domain-containing protein [Gulosibacter sediminis]|uniref:serine hydrolase domain-containing protein n=1 Tax=Gulosibacter sediminis TaxID=1729695 RepID=UPI0024A9FB4C|nr:serine hydrolase domain-containing protein [Gulosibacter sediminis]